MGSRIDAAKQQSSQALEQLIEATGIDGPAMLAWLENEGATRGLQMNEASLADVRDLLAHILQDLILDY